jgi:hypothetical protein
VSDDMEAIRHRHAMVLRPDPVEGRGEAWAAGHSDRGLLLAELDLLTATIAGVVEDESEWDIRIHGSAKARTTLRRLLGVDVDVPRPGPIGCWRPIDENDSNLRAEVDRLTAELAQAQVAYDELCRVAGGISSARQVYGLCPLCSAPGVARERRLDGNDRCSSGHIYPSAMAVPR